MDLEKSFREKIENLKSKEPIEFWPVAAVVFAATLGFYLRYRPAEGMRYLQALDSYFVYKMSQHLALEGSYPALDFMRYFPYATPVYTLNIGNIAIPAMMYYAFPWLFLDYLTWAQIYPAVMGGISVVVAYFLGKEIWDKYAGAGSAFFVAVIAGAMQRQGAGFFQKEATAIPFMLISLLFFLKAWKERNRYYGMVSGAALAIMSVSWGGSSMMWLLYPLVVGTVAFIDEDIEGLVAAYTPTVVLGALLTVAINPGRIWFTSTDLVVNYGMLGLLWARYLIGEFQLVKDEMTQYVFPGISVGAGILALLSPLYSNWLAGMVSSAISKGLRTGSSDVVRGTVAESQPAGIGELITQLGAAQAMQVNQFLGLFANIGGSWPMTFVSVPLIATVIVAMLGKKYDVWGSSLKAMDYVKLFVLVYSAWFLGFAYLFQDNILFAAGPATLLVIAGIAAVYNFDLLEEEIEIGDRWYLFLPLIWLVSNILGGVDETRLLFLASFAASIGAGYVFSRVFIALKDYDYTVIDSKNARQIRVVTLAALVLLVVSINTASGFASSERIGESPNEAWVDSLEWIDDNTEEGSVLLSWWDYGYWFEAFASRASVADGGNLNYMTGENEGKLPYRIAPYLTGETDGEELFEKHSVDYIVLDETMIGKYQAVSQIANRDNDFFYTMQTVTTTQPLISQLQETNGSATFQSRRGGQMRVYADFNEQGEIERAPTVETALGRGQVDCFLDDSGRTEFDTDGAEVPAIFFHQPADQTETLEVCLAEHPHRNFNVGFQGGHSSMVLVPKEIADSNLVELYLMNGVNLDYAEPVPEASNGFVRVWEVDQ